LTLHLLQVTFCWYQPHQIFQNNFCLFITWTAWCL